MSATVNKFGTVNHLDDVKTILVPEDPTRQEVLRDDDWDNRWNWDSSKLVYEQDNDDRKHLWLNECIVAVSPFTDTLVIGRHKTLAIFHWRQPDAAAFDSVYTTSLPGLDKDECLTSLVLLPFVSHKKSAVNFRDWTAIVAGFSSGYFRIYSENGKVLLSQLFHDEPVLDVKCRTYPASNPLLADQIDEILVIHHSTVIQIDGFSLCQTLRLCRNRLTQSDSVDVTGQGFLDAGGQDHQTSLMFKKWAFENESDGQVYDCVNVCGFVKNDFDGLVSLSINNGRKPMSNDYAQLFFTAGTNPYVGWYRAQEGTMHQIFEQFSKALFNKVRNFFSTFTPPSASAAAAADPKDRIKPATNVPADLAMYDERLGVKVCLSPNRRLAAVMDDFGRVVLFDMHRQIAVRMWKGYRRAEVGWIVAEEDHSGAPVQECPKQALFLVIYAPKRGILEIWCAQNGPRVTAFNVGRHCRLLYSDHHMFGLNNVIMKQIKQTLSPEEYRRYFAGSRCFLFNFETGTIFNIAVPFLCSLTDRNSKKTRDMHILKDLKSLLKKEDSFEAADRPKFYADVGELIAMLKTAEMRREAIDHLVRSSQDPEFILFGAKRLYQILTDVETNELDFENKLNVQMCARIVQLTRYYLHVKREADQLLERFERLVADSRDPPDIHQLMEKLDGWTGADVLRLLSLLAFRQSVLKTEPNPPDPMELSVGEFLSHFTLFYNNLAKHNQERWHEQIPVEILLMKSTTPAGSTETELIKLEKLSRFLFNATLLGEAANLDLLLNEVCIFPWNLLLLLFNAWLNAEYSIYWPSWEPFFNTFTRIVAIINDGHDGRSPPLFDFSAPDDHLCASWTDIITMIYKSTNIVSAFIAINMIKALVHQIKLEHRKAKPNELDDPGDSEIQSTHSFMMAADNEWETLHLDKENLNLLAKQLEDLFLLDLLLKSSSSETSTAENVSLSAILTNGPGIVSEIVARWAVHHRIEPEVLALSPRSDQEENRQPPAHLGQDDGTDQGMAHINDRNQNETWLSPRYAMATEMSTLNAHSTLIEILDHVRRCFPNCLDSDILLLNCFWEMLVQWNGQPLLHTGQLARSLEYLERVSSAVLKQNVSAMAWRLFIQKRFETLCLLIEKMGRKPKDRITRKELELDENDLEQFCTFCCDLLDFMIRTRVSSETEALPVYSVDDWWSGFNSSPSGSISFPSPHHYSPDDYPGRCGRVMAAASAEMGPSAAAAVPPLAVMAMHQKAPHIQLLVAYHHLAQAVQLVVIFSLRNAHPLSLFPSPVRGYLFQADLSLPASTDAFDSPSDPTLEETRFRFLKNAISAIVQTIPNRPNEGAHDDNDDGAVTCHEQADPSTTTCQQQRFHISANKWFAKIIQLAREWSLDVDRIRLQYVHDLFLYGCDPLAQELMATVSDVKSLARQLLIVAGMRIAHRVQTKNRVTLDEVSFLAPNVLMWLKSLVTDPNCHADVPRRDTILLLERIANFLYEDDAANFRICEELLGAMKRSFIK